MHPAGMFKGFFHMHIKAYISFLSFNIQSGFYINIYDPGYKFKFGKKKKKSIKSGLCQIFQFSIVNLFLSGAWLLSPIETWG